MIGRSFLSNHRDAKSTVCTCCRSIVVKYFSVVNQKKMTAISEESWERAFRAVKEMFEIANLLPEQENSLREFLLGQYICCEFADCLWQIFNIPMSSNCGGRSFRKASWFQCYCSNITVASSYGRPGSSTK